MQKGRIYMNYDQLLFSELRVAAVSFGTAELSENNLVKAMTVNEELLALGYTLTPHDVIRLAGSSDIDSFVSRIREYVGDVKAKPMYPDFPSQVMALDECVFRFHQLVHYLTTYGIEMIEGISVTRGWLPEMEDTEKTQEDKRLLDAKTLALIDSKEKYIYPFGKILTRTERMTVKDQSIISECVSHLSPDEITSVTVTFKQNLLCLFNTIFTAADLSSEDKLCYLSKLCQHTGDVWKCMDYSLTRAKYHFRTSQKRLIVKLLESYPLSDFKANLVLSNKKAERTLLMLKFIDFNEYSRKPDFKKTVEEFRSGKIRSWESGVKFLVERRAPEALEVYSERPGMMLRHLTYLLRNGYKAEDIFAFIKPSADKLKTQTLVSLVSFFRNEVDKCIDERSYNEGLILGQMTSHLLENRLAANETELKGKKIYVDDSGFDLARSSIRVTDKSDEGGYIRSGLAYKIPEDVKCIRFFIYWNDKNRVDVDLHASGLKLDGSQIVIGWNANFKDDMIVFSGDITHSDAAEYIDIDLDKAKDEVESVVFNINLFSGYPTFSEIDECFVGAMAVSNTGTDVKLYDPKNCFFVHYLKSKVRIMNYGYVDVQNRVIVFDGIQGDSGNYYMRSERNISFTAEQYLDMLFRSQGAERVSSREQADTVLVMGKPSAENELSIIDNNFFME